MNVKFDAKLGLLTATLILFGSVYGKADTLYWGAGTSDIADETPLPTIFEKLTGTWNTTAKNWTPSLTGDSYRAWENGAHDVWLGVYFSSGSSATITIDDNITLRGLFSRWSGASNSATLTLLGNGARKITFAGDAPLIFLDNGTMSRIVVFSSGLSVAAHNLTFTGQSQIKVRGDWSEVTGDLNVTDAHLQLDNTSDLTGISSLTINKGGKLEIVQASSGAVGLKSDAAPILQDSSQLIPKMYRGQSAALGKIILDGFGVINLNTAAGGSGANGELVLTHGFDRGLDGRGGFMLIEASSEVLNNTITLANGTANAVLPYAMTKLGAPVRLNSNKSLEIIPTTSAPANLADWVSGQYYVISRDTTVSGTIGNDLSIKSLGVLKGANTITIADGKTLTISEGGIARDTTSGRANFLITGGKLTSGSEALYLYASEIDSARSIYIESEITGNIDLVTAGTSETRLSGSVSNTYTGKTYANSGTLSLQKTAGAIACPGDLIIAAGATVSLDSNASGQIAEPANITIRDGGTLFYTTQAAPQTHSGILTIDGGQIKFGETNNKNWPRFTHSGSTGLIFNGGLFNCKQTSIGNELYILTDVSYAASSRKQAIFVDGRRANSSFSNLPYMLMLSEDSEAVTRVWDIAKSSFLADDQPEMQVMHVISRKRAGPAKLRKTGDGALELLGGNEVWSDELEIAGGTVIADSGVPVVTMTGKLTHKSNLVKGVDTSKLRPGMRVTGKNISAARYFGADVEGYHTIIQSIDSPDQVTLSKTSLVEFTSEAAEELKFGCRTETITKTGNLTTGSPVVTGLDTTADLWAGQPFSRADASKLRTRILSIDSETQITLATNADITEAGATLEFVSFVSIPEYSRHIEQTGNATSGSAIISDLTTTAGLTVGQQATGPFSGGNARILRIDSATQVTMDKNANSTGNKAMEFLGFSAVGQATITVKNGGTFGGTGAAGKVQVEAGGTLDPGKLGNKTGTLTAGEIELLAGSTLKLDLAAASHDQLVVYGDLTLCGQVEPLLAEGYAPPTDTSWIIATLPDGGSIDLTGVSCPAEYSIKSTGNEVVLTSRSPALLIIVR